MNKIQNKQTGEVIKSDGFIRDECSFKPQVSPLSTQIASKSRLSQGKYKFYETLTEKVRKTDEWRTVQKEKQEKELLKECTFTPEIHTQSKILPNSTLNHTKSERTLFPNKSSEKCLKHKQEVTSKECGQNKESRNQKGSLRRSNKSAIILKHAKFNNISKQSVNDSVRRIREANHEKEIIKIMSERGV